MWPTVGAQEISVEMERETGRGLAGHLKYKTRGSDHADGHHPGATLGSTETLVIATFLFKKSKVIGAICLDHTPICID